MSYAITVLGVGEAKKIDGVALGVITHHAQLGDADAGVGRGIVTQPFAHALIYIDLGFGQNFSRDLTRRGRRAPAQYPNNGEIDQQQQHTI